MSLLQAEIEEVRHIKISLRNQTWISTSYETVQFGDGCMIQLQGDETSLAQRRTRHPIM